MRGQNRGIMGNTAVQNRDHKSVRALKEITQHARGDLNLLQNV